MKLYVTAMYIILLIIISDSGLARPFAYNSTENVIEDDDWMHFFYPKIKVLDSQGCHNLRDTDQVLSPGDCEYSCPQNVMAVKTMCTSLRGKIVFYDDDGGKSFIILPDKGGDTSLIKPDKNGDKSCICAYTTDSCNKGFKHGVFDPAGVWKTLLGCYILPLGPPPPPFCDNCGSTPTTTKIVPVKEATLVNPMIKVMVGKDTEKLCDDGQRIKIGDIKKNCTKTQEILHYNSAILKPGQETTLTYGEDGTKYKFVASLKNNQICAEGTSIKEDKSIQEDKSFNKKQCYELEGIPKPIIKSGDDKKLTIVVAGYNHDMPFDIFHGQKYLDGALSVVRPKRDKDGVIMRDKKGKIIEDRTGDLCIELTPHENDFSIKKEDGTIVRLKAQHKAFLPVKKTIVTIKDSQFSDGQDTHEMWIKDNIRQSLSIRNTNQNILDTIKNARDGTILLRPHMNTEEHFKYQSTVANIGGKNTPYVSYKDAKVGKPILLADDEIYKLRPTNDFKEDLCFKQKKTAQKATQKTKKTTKQKVTQKNKGKGQ